MLKKLIRKAHEKVVKAYIPDDGQIELANALFNWKYKK